MELISNLGVMDAPLILFGGPYSNKEALEALLEQATQLGVPGPRMISTGDLVAYCADGQGCIDLVRRHDIQVVAGNCEQQLAAGAMGCGCGFDPGSTCETLSKGWYPHALSTVTDEAKAWMGGLPDMLRFEHHGKKYAVIHGGASDISKFIWSNSDAATLQSELDLLPGDIDVVFAGHSGIAFSRSIRGKTWVNVGALGMPQNDGDPRTGFVVLEAGNVRFERLNYDYQTAAEAMIAAGLTQGYETALLTGYWPSEDILPLELRKEGSDLRQAG